jgi:hypothetical protein
MPEDQTPPALEVTKSVTTTDADSNYLTPTPVTDAQAL